MRSEDWIQGPVVLVLSGDTFEMQVTLVGRHNDYPYHSRESIRIASSSPVYVTLAGEEAQTQLEEWLQGRTVRCYVHSRDLQGLLYCDVEIVDA